MKKVNFICPVPQEQRPINEYKKVKDSVSFFWSTEDFRSYCQNIFKVTFISLFLNFFLVLESRKDNIAKVSDKEPKTSQCHRIEGLPVP